MFLVLCGPLLHILFCVCVHVSANDIVNGLNVLS